MAKIIQNSLVTPSNLLFNSLFLRGGGYLTTFQPVQTIYAETYIVPQWTISTDNGILYNVTLTRGYDNIRVQGKFVPNPGTTGNWCIKLRNHPNILGLHTGTDGDRYYPFTMGCSLKDNVGNLSHYAYSYAGTINVVTGAYNNYYYNTEKLTTQKKQVLCIIRSKARFQVCIRTYLSKIPSSGVDVDITYSDFFLYEGMFLNPPVYADELSLTTSTAVNYYVPPSNDASYLLPENLPPNARLERFTGQKIADFYNTNPNASNCYWTIRFGNSTTTGKHYILKGSLYFIPNTYERMAVFKYNVYIIHKRSSSGWTYPKESISLDESFSWAVSNWDTQDSPKVSIAHHNYSASTHVLINFHHMNDSHPIAYSRWVIYFVPEVDSFNYDSSAYITTWYNSDNILLSAS